ncbi:MAG TPA: HD domain-containing protein [Candidatus Saccharimonadales bacterium]|nr:HD domain-containing protein [Candidatus Saccharimonadales bacterium]
MNKDAIIEQTASFVRKKFETDSSGHDWWHMYRVWQLAKSIAATEKEADLFVVELGALLHDVADWKLHDGDEEGGVKVAREWLESLGVEKRVVDHVEDIMRTVSFQGANIPPAMKTIEGKIIHDADKLDAMGAVGIARAFAYGGAHNHMMHDPEVKPEAHNDFESYKNSKSPSITHFYEKLLLLKDRMYTKTARQMAEHRHQYMEQYLEEFYAEWEGKK